MRASWSNVLLLILLLAQIVTGSVGIQSLSGPIAGPTQSRTPAMSRSTQSRALAAKPCSDGGRDPPTPR